MGIHIPHVGFLMLETVPTLCLWLPVPQVHLAPHPISALPILFHMASSLCSCGESILLLFSLFSGLFTLVCYLVVSYELWVFLLYHLPEKSP